MHRPENSFLSLLILLFQVFIVCVNRVHSLVLRFVKTVDYCRSYAQVVFATIVLGTITILIRVLSLVLSQVPTQDYYGFNSGSFLVLHTFHNTNKGYYKGD